MPHIVHATSISIPSIGRDSFNISRCGNDINDIKFAESDLNAVILANKVNSKGASETVTAD
ncbi:hypothetical protein FOTG_11262 [Fusarium oxysporum f. sp. vasinfectum 25433]|jgi:hypothetical protein|uniref:Uncharacterized protein n=1 Tax=Fusarium oxysporum f. sp. vasinfectum 25433 TaxID=1089449 RepID=X0L4M3_FUSOX|nr:hypothetical protein FOTG_11262 [Fusarium oxysporum f. sp. vasinfectum 25433]